LHEAFLLVGQEDGDGSLIAAGGQWHLIPISSLLREKEKRKKKTCHASWSCSIGAIGGRKPQGFLLP